MELDINLYSRQIGTYGLETMEQLIKKKVYIYGIGGLGLEVAKNIILSGPKKVTINDNNIIKFRDLGSNYFINENNVGKNTRADASLFKLRELNAYVQVEVDKNSIFTVISTRVSLNSLNFLRDYNVLIITEFLPRETTEIINQYCRENKIGFIYCSVTGLAGFIFVDFGDMFIVQDDNGEEIKQFYVRNITKENPGVVIIDDSVDNQKLDLSHGDYVTFREIVGMTELNDTPPRPVRILSPFTFSIEDTSKFSDYICGGIIEQVKVPKPIFNHSLKEAFDNIQQDDMGLNIKSCANNVNVEMLHLAYLALYEFYSKNNRLPEVNDLNDALQMTEISKLIYSVSKDKKRDWALNLDENLNELFIFYLSFWSKLSPAPICSFLGGIVAQEIIKITGKFTPINQWFYCDFFYLLQNEHKKKVVKPNLDDLENRYFDQIAIFGKEVQDNFSKINLFIIGCGALGTEFLKIFSLMGISIGTGKITITDNDIIEISNLNRQLLFKRENVGGFKSKISKDMLKQINCDVNCYDMQIKVDENSEYILDDNFYLNQDIIFTCVDNLETRKYIDRKITLLKKIHIDSGTLGTKAHSQIIVPNFTTNYNDKEDFEGEIAICTLHNFPSQIEHCIEWGKFKFFEYFNENMKNLNNLLINFESEIDNIRKSLPQAEFFEKIIYLNKLTDKIKINKDEEFVILTLEEFNFNFNKKIQKLLMRYPIDYQNKDGSRFWHGAKRPPTAVVPNLQDQNHFLFVGAFCKLISSTLANFHLDSLKKFDDLVFVRQLASTMLEQKIDLFENDKIENNYQNLKKIDYIDVDQLDKETELLKHNLEELKKIFENNSEKIKKNNEMNYEKNSKNFDENSLIKKELIFIPLEFEKDNDFNQHVNFIRACANIRAQNYKIKECDFIKTKLTAGRIIPAIASTTAAITGFSAAQLYSICSDLKNINLDCVKNAFVNLGIAEIIFTETFPNFVFHKFHRKSNINYVVVPESWSVWDYIEVKAENIKTFEKFYEYIEKEYKIKIRKIFLNGKILFEYNILSNSKTELSDKEIFEYAIEKNILNEEYVRNKIDKYLILELMCITVKDEKVHMPLVKFYYF